MLFILALAALAVIGYLGQRGLRSMIVSIEEASRPNPRITGLSEIRQSLSEAESSVRSYIITRDEQTLNAFKQSAATIELRLDQLKEVTENAEQQDRIRRLEELITSKYETLSTLINVRNARDGDVLEKVMQDIDSLKTQAEEAQEAEGEEQDPAVFERLFGEEPDSAARDASISSRQLDQAIDRIDRQQSAAVQQFMAQELRLIRQDNAIMTRIRAIMDEIGTAEERLSSTRTELVRETTGKTINTITTILVITLFVFAFLISVIFNDIRRSRIYRENLRQAKDRAEKLARVKEEFLSNMSHEIRTPLSAVIGFSEQLQDTQLDPDQSRQLSRIKSSGDHLLRLINDILDYARMESGKMELEQTGFRPAEELGNVLALFQAQAASKKLTLRGETAPEVPDILLGDSVRFRQIVINLVGNAIKFTDEGGVTVHLAADPDGDDRCTLHLTVKDTGVGIAADKLNTIFDEFSQADSSTSRRYGGSGLGLSIVSKLASLHDGTVTAESEEGKGTTFHVHLKYREGSEEDLPQPEAENTSDLTGLRALVVDDQPYNLELLETILTHWGVDTTACTSGEEALKKAAGKKFDIAMLDIQMPGMTGLELARRLREDENTKIGCPIVALTAGTSREEREQARAAGMDFFLSKPYKRSDLQEVIARACGRETQPAEMYGEKGNQGTLQLDGLMELAGGDMQFVTNMLTIFRNNFYNDLEKLDEAVQGKDLDGIRSVAHKMSPPCGHLGFSEMAKKLKTLERMSRDGEDYMKIRLIYAEIRQKAKPMTEETDQKITELSENKERV